MAKKYGEKRVIKLIYQRRGQRVNCQLSVVLLRRVSNTRPGLVCLKVVYVIFFTQEASS